MAIVLAFMAGPMELDTGQFITYLFIYALPHIIVELTRQAIPKDRAFYKTLDITPEASLASPGTSSPCAPQESQKVQEKASQHFS